ncbi:MAG: RdgB/HAM1 family non-canonical purine NTP pyrophosphatase [Acidobacteriota bacterium]|nr:RdgB/HAM1 family non-canonical purine NTP pyrophosphatase [Acidobacteriota bacterium]
MLLQLASSNPGKLREFSEAAAEIGARVGQVPGLCNLSPCEEDGETFEANARKKALHFAAYTTGLVFADDSGLCVDALDGAPGVYSARFSGPGATDEMNNRRLIEKLAQLPARVRTRIAAPPFSGFAAHYVCVIALAQGTRILATTEGSVEGVIVDEPRGDNGFGYDPYFFYPQRGKTFAELAAGEKFVVSHRGIAFRKLLATLRRGPQGATPGSGGS